MKGNDTTLALEKAVLEMLTKIIGYVKNLEPYSKGHAERVSLLARETGIRLGLSEEMINTIALAASFHDIGKLGISDSLLLKKGSLNQEEWDKIKTHPVFSVNLLESFPFLEPILPLIKHHHEKYDGTGYPDGLRGLKIPLGARILGVADCFDALVSDRAFRKRFSHEDALKIIKNNLGKNFDPEVGKIFLQLLGEKTQDFLSSS